MSRVAAHDQLSAGALAMLVHLLFFAALVFGVSWKKLPEVPVYADLWRALPEPSAPPLPVPAPPPAVSPPPVRVQAPPLPKADAQIVLKAKQEEARKKKEAEQKRLEEDRARQEEIRKQRRAEETRQAEADTRRRLEAKMRQEEQERLVQEERQLKKRQEEERKQAESKRVAQDKARKEMERLLAQQMDDELAAEDRHLQQQVAASVRNKLVEDYKGRIQLKIRGLLHVPPGVKGNPEAIYRVELLPTGDVVRVTLLRASGQPVYDQEVERAIRKASPLPLPPDKEAAAAFRDGLELRFRPQDS